MDSPEISLDFRVVAVRVTAEPRAPYHAFFVSEARALDYAKEWHRPPMCTAVVVAGWEPKPERTKPPPHHRKRGPRKKNDEALDTVE